MELVRAATEVVDSHGEDPVHTVAAAVRTEDGSIHVGLNLYHFTGGPCAELVALGAARTAGGGRPVTIVAVGDGGRGVIGPCGRDRQVMADYYPGIVVLVPTAEGVRSVAVEALLPLPNLWSPDPDDR